VLIRYWGHSTFELESAGGYTLATDPFDPTVGYPMPSEKAQGITMSHGHFDHHYPEAFEGAEPMEGEGEWQPAPGVRVRSVAAWHDECQGQKRGSNRIFCIEMDGLRLCHLGDFGEDALSPEQLAAIGPVDILFVPVGGYYTLSPEKALDVVRQLTPRVTIPMHYKTRVNADWAIEPLSTFEALAGKCAGPYPILRVTKEDIGCLPKLIEMSWDW